jgi:polygalacturonase
MSEPWGAVAYADEAPPAVGALIADITAYGAVGDGKQLCTASIQKALNAGRDTGGGELLIPPGTFLTGPLVLCSNLDLHLEKGATLLITENIATYPRDQRGYIDCIKADGCHDLSITGEGVIDGQGGAWWPLYKKQPGAPAAANESASASSKNNGAPAADPATLPHRPFLVALRNCRHVLISGVTLRNSPMFHLVPQRCRDVVIDSITIVAPSNSPNTDGIDPSGWNFLITRCTIDVGDDCIALKPSGGSSPLQPAADSLSCEDFTITHCTFLHGHGMSIGNPTPGGLRRMTVSDCTFNSTEAGIRMKTHRDGGGVVEDLTYRNLVMTNVKVPILITSYYPTIPAHPEDEAAQPVGKSTPIFRHIHIENLTATGAAQAGRIIGLPEEPIFDVQLDHVSLSGKTGLQIVDADGIQFADSTVSAASGPDLIVHAANITGIDPQTGQPSTTQPAK